MLINNFRECVVMKGGPPDGFSSAGGTWMGG